MNRKLLYMVWFSLMSIFPPTYAQTQRGLKIEYLPSGKAYYNYQDSWAVLIGINDFDYWPKLEFAVQDAQAMKDLLIKQFGFKEDHIIFLMNKRATLQNIKKTLGYELAQKVGRNDRVLVFWAGHGQTFHLPEGGKMGYLIPVDGSRTDYYATCLSMTEIKNLSRLIPAKHVLFLVDACYGGLAASQTRSLPPETAAYLEKITRARGRQIITAGGENEEVVENSLWGHSAFTYQLIEGLKNRVADEDNDGIITSTELYNYLKKRVTKLSGYKQTPQYRFLSGDGEFVFITKAAFNKNENVLGMIHIRTKPWCKVFLDGKELCTSPYIIKNVPSGYHQLVLRRNGYNDVIKNITISENERYIRISETLSK